MPTLEALEERVENLERRISECEGQFGFLLPLVRQLHREILALREDTQRLDGKVDRLEDKLGGLEGRVGALESKVDQGFALMARKFHEVGQALHGIKGTLDALPRVVAEEIARRR